MPALMAASDAIVENAGGLSAMEAFAARLPVVSFQPIAGHGKDNAKYMAVSGVSRYAHNHVELADALRDATQPGPARGAMIAAGEALFAGDPSADVVQLAAETRAHALLTPLRTSRSRRRLSLAAASLAGLYLALTIGTHGVAALGVGVAKPPKGATNTVYLGVRASAEELADPDVVGAVERLGITVVVDAATATRADSELRGLADAGVDIANGGWGKGKFLRWDRAQNDCDTSFAVIAAHTGERTHEFVPGRSFDAFDQLYCRTGDDKQRLVRPSKVFQPEDVPSIEARKVYLLDGRARDPMAVAFALADFEAMAEAAGLRVRPLADLR
jgi:hypothetical protein